MAVQGAQKEAKGTQKRHDSQVCIYVNHSDVAEGLTGEKIELNVAVHITRLLANIPVTTSVHA